MVLQSALREGLGPEEYSGHDLGFEQSLKRKENVAISSNWTPARIQGSPTYTASCLFAVPKPKDYKWAPEIGGDVYLTLGRQEI